MRLSQCSMSRLVYPTIVGLPVVPDEACMRTSSEEGTAHMPQG
jgi:hypothetical protein